LADLLIRGNTFIGCGIEITPETKSNKPEEPIHENIRITDNDLGGARITTKSVKGLVITGNRSLGALKIEPSCSDVVNESNGQKK
jgi:hypothetical protein